MSDSENLHKDHRRRLKQRFMSEGLSSFDDHEILELLLFFGIPRKDTNIIAHRLMKQFGSLSAVFDTDFEQLIECNGVGESCAVLIKMIPELLRAYKLDKYTRYPKFDSSDKVGKYLVNFYLGATVEKLVAIYLNQSMEVIETVIISEGSVNESDISARKIIEEGFKRKAAFVALAHNHPDGIAAQSSTDRYVINEIGQVLSKVNMPLLEHFIITSDSYVKTICIGEWRMPL